MIELFGNKYFTRNEVAKKFDVDPETVSRWRRKGKLKAYALNKRKYLFSEEELEKFVKRNEKNEILDKRNN